MKLSEAIRLGAMLGDQLRDGHTYKGDDTCAIGSAMLAIGRRGECYVDVADHWPVAAKVVQFPAGVTPIAPGPSMVLSIIRELNDHHYWTREQIADWVESIERAQETQIGSATQASMEPALSTHRSNAQEIATKQS